VLPAELHERIASETQTKKGGGLFRRRR
jgi:hypothetical protein